MFNEPNATERMILDAVRPEGGLPGYGEYLGGELRPTRWDHLADSYNREAERIILEHREGIR